MTIYKIIGVISGNPAVVTDNAWNHWSEKYLKDDFNCYIWEEHQVIEWTDENDEIITYEDWNLPDGLVIPENATYRTHDDSGKRLTHKKLNPVQYSLKSDPESKKIGFISQEAQSIIPESVFDTKEQIEGYPEHETQLGMEYVSIIPVLVNAIKELSAEVESLKQILLYK